MKARLGSGPRGAARGFGRAQSRFSARAWGLGAVAALGLAAAGAVGLGLTAPRSADAQAAQPLQLLAHDENLLQSGAMGGRNPQVSAGNTLIGLSLGASSAADPLNIRRIRVALSEPQAGPRLCIEMTTADGRYYAYMHYRAVGAFDPAPEIGFQSRHAGSLSRLYTSDELAVLSRRGDDCRAPGPSAVYTPVVADPNAGELIALVNIGGQGARVRSRLRDASGAEAAKRVRCARDQRVAYTRRCALNIEGLPAGRYTLEVESRTLTLGSNTWSFTVVLP